MSELPPLMLEMVSNRPDVAGGVLATVTTQDAAAFLKTLEPDLGARLIEAMPLGPAASAVALMPADAAASLMQGIRERVRVSVLRSMPDAPRHEIVAALPASQRDAFISSLSYKSHQVGAWVTRQIPTLAETAGMKEALDLIKAGRDTATAQVYVVGPDQQFCGIVTAATLLRAPEGRSLGEIAVKKDAAVGERDSLSEVAEETAWDSLTGLPVVDAEGVLVGVITWRAMRLGLAELRAPVSAPGTSSIIGELGGAYLAVASHLLNLATASPNPENRP
ncbi:MAG: CBS domain-containing protein [Alphaproteobacteria bacterium]